MKLKEIFQNKKSEEINYYENSTQKWLTISEFRDGIVVMKDGRYVKVIEVLPVNFYLKSETEQQNIIYYYASYLKIAPDNMQIRVRRKPIYQHILRGWNIFLKQKIMMSVER